MLVVLQRGTKIPLHRQIETSIRDSIRAGQLPRGSLLPPSRVLAADLSPDHGYPARVIVPALPGVHCTKWVRSITFREA